MALDTPDLHSHPQSRQNPRRNSKIQDSSFPCINLRISWSSHDYQQFFKTHNTPEPALSPTPGSPAGSSGATGSGGNRSVFLGSSHSFGLIVARWGPGGAGAAGDRLGMSPGCSRRGIRAGSSAPQGCGHQRRGGEKKSGLKVGNESPSRQGINP